jgi:hypothetical protein
VSIVLYKGPSMLDGTPIVALASLDSRNRKTGPMIQTWIVPQVGPLLASHRGRDGSVCGDCPRRHSLGGDCYVLVFNAPHSAWKAWVRDGRPAVNWDHHTLALQREAMHDGLRLGAYGDPAAVPVDVWHGLIDAIRPRVVTGYTHQWRNPVAAEYRTLLMASADSAADAELAHAAGWRYFAAVPNADGPKGLPGRVVECLADARGTTCRECGVCDGARSGRDKQPASVWIAEHGIKSVSKAQRSASLSVIR